MRFQEAKKTKEDILRMGSGRCGVEGPTLPGMHPRLIEVAPEQGRAWVCVESLVWGAS